MNPICEDFIVGLLNNRSITYVTINDVSFDLDRKIALNTNTRILNENSLRRNMI